MRDVSALCRKGGNFHVESKDGRYKQSSFPKPYQVPCAYMSA